MADLEIGGVDGGASRTRARLVNTRGETLGNAEAGTWNPNASGFPPAQSEVLRAMEPAFVDAHIEKKMVARRYRSRCAMGENHGRGKATR